MCRLAVAKRKRLKLHRCQSCVELEARGNSISINSSVIICETLQLIPPCPLLCQIMPHAMAPTMYGVESAYRVDYGEDCSDPMERSAPGERFQSRMTTGRDLAAGTTRVTNNPPGYTGHIAASK